MTSKARNYIDVQAVVDQAISEPFALPEGAKQPVLTGDLEYAQVQEARQAGQFQSWYDPPRSEKLEACDKEEKRS
jgi:hypothetical protein